MADDRPFNSTPEGGDGDLPEWLRGHIHEDDESAEPPEAGPQAETGLDAEDIFGPEDEALPWLADVLGGETPPEPSPAEQPGEIRGLTDMLPWLGDEASEGPSAEEPPPAEGLPPERAIEEEGVADWLAEAPTPGLTPLAPEGEGKAALTPDWLSDEAAAPEPEAIPDWLAAAEAFEPEAEAPPAAAVPAEAEAVPDWLAGAGPFAPEAPSPAEEEAPEAGAVPDWLAVAEELDLGEGLAAAPPAAEAEAPPDWLAAAEEFPPEAEIEEAAPAEAEAEAEATPDWLAADLAALELEEEVSGETYEEWEAAQLEAEREPSPEELLAAEVPDWFAGVEEEAPETPPVRPPAPEEKEAEFVPDWYLGLEEQDTSEAPEWFGDLKFSTDMLSAAPTLPEEPVLEEAPPEEAFAPMPGTEADLFGLSDLDLFAAPKSPPDVPLEPALETSPEPAPLDEADLFAFGEESLADLEGAPEPPLPETAPSVEAAPPLEEEVPDWFAAFEEEAGPETPPEPSPEAAAVPPADLGALAQEVPDWLGELPEDVSLAARAEEAAGEPDFMRVIERGLGGTGPLEELGVAEGAQLLTEQQADFDLDAFLEEQALPELPTGPEEALPPELPPGVDVTAIPDWLLQARPDQAAVGGRVSAVDAALRRPETPLEELTDRLRALHTLTSRAAEAEPAPAETPPARSVLTGVTDGLTLARVFREVEAPTRAVEVTLDEAQQARVAALESLLGVGAEAAEVGVPFEEEFPLQYDAQGQPLPVDEEARAKAIARATARETARLVRADRRARARSRRKPDRLLVTVLLLVAMLLPFLVGGARFVALPPAALDDAVHGEMDAAIARLRPGTLVLVGFEYGPTAAGEMDSLAETLLTHILLRRARPIVVSTNPAGVLHAQNVLQALANDPFLLAHLGRAPDDPLVAPDDYVILPYLAGGAVGLRALTVGGPERNALFAVDLAGRSTGFKQVEFGPVPASLDPNEVPENIVFILALAERGEDVRLWVEQVGAVASSVPMAAAVSVAAEPVARPYFESGQLVGLLAGFRDAYTYDRVLLASLPEVTPLPTQAPTGAAGGMVGEDTSLAASATPGAPDAGVGLVTRQPTATPTPTITATPPATLTHTPEPTSTPTLSARDLTATERATALGTAPPPSETPLPTPRVVQTIAPTPTVVEGEPGAAAAQPQVVQADRLYRDERWYSMGLGALAATALIGLGAVVNVVRGIRRRREQ